MQPNAFGRLQLFGDPAIKDRFNYCVYKVINQNLNYGKYFYFLVLKKIRPWDSVEYPSFTPCYVRNKINYVCVFACVNEFVCALSKLAEQCENVSRPYG